MYGLEIDRIMFYKNIKMKNKNNTKAIRCELTYSKQF